MKIINYISAILALCTEFIRRRLSVVYVCDHSKLNCLVKILHVFSPPGKPDRHSKVIKTNDSWFLGEYMPEKGFVSCRFVCYKRAAGQPCTSFWATSVFFTQNSKKRLLNSEL
jgi:hypothetical protein